VVFIELHTADVLCDFSEAHQLGVKGARSHNLGVYELGS
jgi:hypothetical protein